MMNDDLDYCYGHHFHDVVVVDIFLYLDLCQKVVDREQIMNDLLDYGEEEEDVDLDL